MNLAFARLEPYSPLSPWMQTSYRRKSEDIKYILFNISVN